MATITKTAITTILLGDSVEPVIANTPHDNLETNIDSLINYIKASVIGAFEYDSVTSTGLTFEFESGTYNNQHVPTVIASGSRSLSPSVTSYIEINTNSNLVTHNSTSFTRDNIPLWEVTTDGSSITGVTDRRSPFNLRSTRGIEDSATTQQLIITNATTTISNNLVLTNASVTGTITFDTRPAFNGGLSGSTSPFTVDSTFVVADLNADLLDGLDQSDFIRSNVADTVSGILTFNARPAFNGGTGSSSPFTVDSTFLVTNLNADLLDGLDQSDFIRSNVADTFTGTLTGQKGNAAAILEFTNTATTNELHLRTYTSDYIGFRPAPAGVGAGTKDFFYNFTSSRWQFDESPYIGTDPIAALVSPAFTGNPTAPTQTAGDNDTSIATTAFVNTAISGAHDDQIQTLASIERWTGVQNNTTLTWDGTSDSSHVFSGVFALINTAGDKFTLVSQKPTYRKFLPFPTIMYDDSYGDLNFSITGFGQRGDHSSAIDEIPTCYLLNFHNYTSGNATVSFSITVYNYGDDTPNIRLLNNGTGVYTSGTVGNATMATFTGSFTVATGTTANITLEGKYSAVGSGQDAFFLNSINYMRVTF